MKIELEVSEKNESTAFPWWVIIDPRQNFDINEDGLHRVAGMITGPFFSRESAQDFLTATKYNFGKNPHVYCMSGTYSNEYRTAIRDAEKRDGRRMGDRDD